MWINSAGNFASGYVWEPASDLDGNNYHDFRSTDNTLRIQNSATYRGNIILSWRQIGEDPEIPADIAFELEVIDLSTENVIGQPIRVTESTQDSRFRRVLVNTTGGFGIKVRANYPLRNDQFALFRLVLFVELIETFHQQSDDEG